MQVAYRLEQSRYRSEIFFYGRCHSWTWMSMFLFLAIRSTFHLHIFISKTFYFSIAVSSIFIVILSVLFSISLHFLWPLLAAIPRHHPGQTTAKQRAPK